MRTATVTGGRMPDFAPLRNVSTAENTACSSAVSDALARLPQTERMPAVFLGHGSPMNAIEDNPFTRSLVRLASEIPRPAAVLVVSAHWLTDGETRVLCAEKPPTIHDFYGFPRELFAVEYPASGAPDVAEAVSALTGAARDSEWGLDHASWAVLRHMYPGADVPVLELSVDMTAPGPEHVALGRLLVPLRERGVLVLGSGNIVHNLGAIDWEHPDGAYDWAVEFDGWARDRLLEGDVDALAGWESQGRAAELSVPTPDHYLPLLYAAALRAEDEPVAFTYEGMAMGSISMRGVRFG